MAPLWRQCVAQHTGLGQPGAAGCLLLRRVGTTAAGRGAWPAGQQPQAAEACAEARASALVASVKGQALGPQAQVRWRLVGAPCPSAPYASTGRLCLCSMEACWRTRPHTLCMR